MSQSQLGMRFVDLVKVTPDRDVGEPDQDWPLNWDRAGWGRDQEGKVTKTPGGAVPVPGSLRTSWRSST